MRRSEVHQCFKLPIEHFRKVHGNYDSNTPTLWYSTVIMAFRITNLRRVRVIKTSACPDNTLETLRFSHHFLGHMTHSQWMSRSPRGTWTKSTWR